MDRSREEIFAALVGGLLPKSSLTSRDLRTFLADPEALRDRLPDSLKDTSPEFSRAVRDGFRRLGAGPFDRAFLIPLIKPLLESALEARRVRPIAEQETEPIWCMQPMEPVVENLVETRPRPGEIALNVGWDNGRPLLEAGGHRLDIGAAWLPGDQFALKVGSSLLVPLVSRATFRCGLADFATGRLLEAKPSTDPKLLVGLVEQSGKGMLVTSIVDRTAGVSVKRLRIYKYDPGEGELSLESDSVHTPLPLYWLDTLHVRNDEVFAVGHSKRGAAPFLLYGLVARPG